MVLIVFGALAYAQERRAHIRVDLLYGQSVRAESRSWSWSPTSWRSRSSRCSPGRASASALQLGDPRSDDGHVRFPLYPARFCSVLGAALLLLRLAFDIAGELGRLRRGEPPPAPSGNAAVE